MVLRLVVTASGSTEHIQVIRGLGPGADKQVIDAVKKWRFKPAIGPDGKPHAVKVVIGLTLQPI